MKRLLLLALVAASTVQAQTQVIECASACTVTLQLQAQGAWTLTGPQFFELTLEEGAAIASAVLAVWVIGWACRALIRTLRNSDGISSTNPED